MEKYKQYAELQKKIEELEGIKDSLRAEILDIIKKKGIEKEETEFGTFTICKKTNWVYTDNVKKLKEKVKMAEITEQEKGIAKENITEYIKFSANESV